MNIRHGTNVCIDPESLKLYCALFHIVNILFIVLSLLFDFSGGSMEMLCVADGFLLIFITIPVKAVQWLP